MTDQELKRMSRGDLIEIIYQYQSREREYVQKISDLTERLKDRSTKIENAGSIAEAALALNQVFEAAQAAADQYVAEVQSANADKGAQAQKILSEAVSQADTIRQQAQREYDAMLEKAKQECDAMYNKITELLRNYEELRGLLPR